MYCLLKTFCTIFCSSVSNPELLIASISALSLTWPMSRTSLLYWASHYGVLGGEGGESRVSALTIASTVAAMLLYSRSSELLQGCRAESGILMSFPNRSQWCTPNHLISTATQKDGNRRMSWSWSSSLPWACASVPILADPSLYVSMICTPWGCVEGWLLGMLSIRGVASHCSQIGQPQEFWTGRQEL